MLFIFGYLGFYILIKSFSKIIFSVILIFWKPAQVSAAAEQSHLLRISEFYNTSYFQAKNCKVKVIRTSWLLAKFQSSLTWQLSSLLFHMSCSTAVPLSSRKSDFIERESEQFLPLAYFIIYCSISLHSSGIFCVNSFHYSQSHTNSLELSSENSSLPAKTSNKKLPGKVTKDF